MATIEVKGYVNKPLARTGGGKTFSTFTLAERQLHGKDKTPVKVFYDVTDWDHAEPPKESSFVTLKGYLNIEKVEKEGKTYTNLRIKATSIDVSEGRGNGTGTGGAAKDEFSDVPF